MRNRDFIVLVIRLFLGYVYFSSGLCKLSFGFFPQLIGPPDLITNLAQYQLEGLGYTIAIMQVLSGALILSQSFSLLGLVMLLPISVSILCVTISMQWAGTPYINAFILVLNLWALFYEWDALKHLLFPWHQPLAPTVVKFFPASNLALGIILFAVLSIVFSFISKHAVVVVAIILFSLLILLLWRSNLPVWYQAVSILMVACIVSFTFSRYSLWMQKKAVIFFSAYFLFCLTGLMVALVKHRFRASQIDE